MNSSFQFAGSLFPALTQLQQQLDEVFRMDGTANIRALSGRTFPAVNIGSTPDAVEVIAFAPGIDPKALQITIDKGLLVISGERAENTENKEREDDVSVYAQERFTGQFRRVISLPEDADPNQVHATCRDGIVRVSVAKRESAKPRQIAVN
jgi:HSP20 family protein